MIDQDKSEKCKYCGKKITEGEYSDNNGYCDDCSYDLVAD